MRHKQIVAATLLALTGCAQTGHPMDCLTGAIAWSDCPAGSAGYDRRFREEAADDTRCQSYGAKPGSDLYFNCRMALSTHRDDINQAQLDAVRANLARQAAQPPAPPPLLSPYVPPRMPTQCMTNAIGQTIYTNCN